MGKSRPPKVHRYRNDVEGASAFDPAVLIKIILLAYSRGIIHSRKIAAACRENVLFIAVSGDSQPHFSTLAAFVSNMGELVAKLFAQVLLICDRQGLIGREMFAIDRSHYIFPAGKRLYSNGSNCTIKGYVALKFSGAKQDCMPCERRQACLRTPEKTPIRQVSFLQGKRDEQENHVDLMKGKIDSATGREMITRRFATVEPVFGNKRLHRFTLHGKAKVDGQWKLYCMMHNIEKLANHGYAR